MSHWIKNLALFLPSFFAGDILALLNGPSFFDTILLFALFCTTSSAIYVFNDIIDVDFDRMHPVKKTRPVANGIISKQKALFFGLVLCAISVLLLTKTGKVGLFALVYFFLNILYIFKLRMIPIVDVATISVGFLLRIFAGGFITNIAISHWMVIIVFLLASSLGFAKRRNELMIMKSSPIQRVSMTGYNIIFLDIAKTIGFSVTLVAYVLYSVSPEVMARFNTDKLYITSLFVFVGILRYLQLSTVKKITGNPVRVLLTDSFSQVIILLWIISFALIIYGGV